MSSPNLPERFSWVVLRKDIPIFDADKKNQEDLVMANASKDWADIKDGSSILEQFSLDAHLVEPPELSTLYVRAKLEVLKRGIFCILDSVVENFVCMSLMTVISAPLFVTSAPCADDEDRVELGFIHLPEECKGQVLEGEGYYRHAFEDAYPRERQTMGPVGNSIKLISIVTTDGDTPDDHTHARDIVIQSWTLAPDLCTWTRDHDMELPLPQLWESDAYKREGLPEAIPQNPVLKDDEDGVLYLLLGDYYVHGHSRLCRTMECVISVDMRRKCLLSRSRRPITDGLLPPLEVKPSKRFRPEMPTLFAVKLCAQHTEWSDDGLLQQKEKKDSSDIDGN
ncbi:unnamed protein product [Alopecurus aequalis]